MASPQCSPLLPGYVNHVVFEEVMAHAVIQAISGLIALCDRHKPASISLLLIYACILLSQLVVATHTSTQGHFQDTLAVSEIAIAFAGIIVILSMPLRDPRLSLDGISPSHSAPTIGLRSPEDDLTLWQFMTVSWMSPLISLGRKKQLNDEDVWDLPYAFQHKGLFNEFRELRGSFLRKLCTANGLDLLISSSLGIIELVASMWHLILNYAYLLAFTDYSCRSLGACITSTPASVHGGVFQKSCCDLRALVFGLTSCCYSSSRLQSLVQQARI